MTFAEGCFSNTCRKINHTRGGLQQYLPSFVKKYFLLQDKDIESHDVKDLAVDDKKNLLFTLSADSVIRAFSFGSDGDDFYCTGSCYQASTEPALAEYEIGQVCTF